jgi:hypothetical protein
VSTLTLSALAAVVSTVALELSETTAVESEVPVASEEEPLPHEASANEATKAKRIVDFFIFSFFIFT